MHKRKRKKCFKIFFITFYIKTIKKENEQNSLELLEVGTYLITRSREGAKLLENFVIRNPTGIEHAISGSMEFHTGR